MSRPAISSSAQPRRSRQPRLTHWNCARRVQDADHGRHVVEDRLKDLLLLRQGRFGALPLGDVDVAAEHAGHGPVVQNRCLHAVEVPHAVRQHAGDLAVHDLARECPPVTLAPGVRTLGVIARLGRRRADPAAEPTGGDRVLHHVPSLVVPDPELERQALQRGVQPRLALAQPLLLRPADADVLEHGHAAGLVAAGVPDAGEREAHMKPAAVLVPVDGLEADDRLAALLPCDQLVVLAPHLLRDVRQRLADHLGAGPAEHPLRPLVPSDDPRALIGRHDCQRRRVEHRPQVLGGRLPGAERALSLGGDGADHQAHDDGDGQHDLKRDGRLDRVGAGERPRPGERGRGRDHRDRDRREGRAAEIEPQRGPHDEWIGQARTGKALDIDRPRREHQRRAQDRDLAQLGAGQSPEGTVQPYHDQWCGEQRAEQVARPVGEPLPLEWGAGIHVERRHRGHADARAHDRRDGAREGETEHVAQPVECGVEVGQPAQQVDARQRGERVADPEGEREQEGIAAVDARDDRAEKHARTVARAPAPEQRERDAGGGPQGRHVPGSEREPQADLGGKQVRDGHDRQPGGVVTYGVSRRQPSGSRAASHGRV